MKVKVKRSGESALSAARLFAGGREVLVYLYTALIVSIMDEYGEIDVDDESLAPRQWVSQLIGGGVWWHVSDGKHGYNDYYLGFACVGDGELLSTRFDDDFVFREFGCMFTPDGDSGDGVRQLCVNPEFDIRRWHSIREEEREHKRHLIASGQEELLAHSDVLAGEEEREHGGRWYRGSRWSPKTVVSDATMAGAERMASYLDSVTKRRPRW